MDKLKIAQELLQLTHQYPQVKMQKFEHPLMQEKIAEYFRKVQDQLAELYVEYFSDEQLQSQLAFYKSDTGQEILKTTQLIHQEHSKRRNQMSWDEKSKSDPEFHSRQWGIESNAPPKAPVIRTLDRSQEYYFKEGCFIIEISNSDADPTMSIAHARVEPGVTTHWHQLTATVERYVILQGEGNVEVGDLPPKAVNIGDVVIIPPSMRQRISNTGKQSLEFLAICTPRFRHSFYLDLESDK